MQLKKIEIAGFKSFAEKTVIEFHEGVTAVVGPNGSGKSNITEAIRWVLGEQSAKSLRGGRMNDIIFAGSQTRKPLNRAEVTLILENEDHFLPLEFSEISITRRLHKNGDSEYYINKQACRLKDIVDLFMDSGLGKESFSIISQGKVEAIFNSKPEDRRTIFEEAAGVLKYKTRKKTAEQKLVETEEHLHRVQDIVYELEGQLEPLKEQSSIAKDYLDQKEQLQDIEISLTVVNVEQLKAKWDFGKIELAAFKEELNKINRTASDLDEQLQRTKDEKKQLTEQIDAIQHQVVATIREYEQTEGHKNVLFERGKNTEENREQYENSKKQKISKIKQYEDQLSQLKQLITEKEKERSDLKEELASVEKERLMLSSDSKQTIEQLRNDYVDLMQQQTSLKNEKSYLEKSLSQVSQKQLKSDAAAKEFENELEKSSEQIGLAAKELKTVQQRIAQKLMDHQERQAAIQKKQNELAQKEQAMYEAMRLVQQTKAKKESLQELNDDYTGFYQGVKEVLKNKNRINGIAGAVAEMITVPKETESAIDSALGAAGQHIIVEKEESARKAIQFLKQKRSGRATFLPLTTIKPRRLPANAEEEAKKSEGYLGIASQIIDFPERISVIIENLLGTTIVAKDLKTANSIARSIQFKYRVVTLDGDVMNAGGSMTGGAVKKNTQGSLFARKNQVRTLSDQIGQMERMLEEKEKEVRGFKQSVKQGERLLEELRESGEEERLKEQELKNQLQMLEERQTRFSKEIKAFQYEYQSVKEEKEQYISRAAEIEQELSAFTKTMAHIDHQIKLASSASEEREQLQQAAIEKIQRLTTSEAALKERVNGLKKEEQSLERQKTDEQVELQKIEKNIQEIAHSADDQQLSQKELHNKLALLDTKKEHLEKELETKKNQRTVFENNIERLDEELTIKNNQKQYNLEQKSKVDVAMNRFDVEIENQLNYLNEEYHLSFEAAKADYSLSLPFEEASKKVKLLKQSIEELGSVNIGAIDEFERVNERYTFLMEQREDLLKAKASLYETMEEMDEEVKRRFSEVFEAVRDRFAIVFPEMFGGGSAQLRLTDPDSLLTTGIDIIAQPPGKKLQHLSLLSGGERAFTAIALLFAIIQAKPVPFCILDEVEAALDEANVVRFGRYLKRIDSDTQFIVITHRKGTMEEANVLYGVTMQESGVSKIVSVRIEEVDDPHIIPLK